MATIVGNTVTSETVTPLQDGLQRSILWIISIIGSLGVIGILYGAIALGWLRVKHNEGPRLRRKPRDLEEVEELPATDAGVAGLVRRELEDPEFGKERFEVSSGDKMEIGGGEKIEIDGEEKIEISGHERDLRIGEERTNGPRAEVQAVEEEVHELP